MDESPQFLANCGRYEECEEADLFPMLVGRGEREREGERERSSHTGWSVSLDAYLLRRATKPHAWMH